MKIKTILYASLLCVTLGNISTVSAKEGWYAGFGIGKNNLELDTPVIDRVEGMAPLLPSDIENVSFNGFDDSGRLGLVLNAGYRLNSYVELNFDFTSTNADIRVGYDDISTSPGTKHFSDIEATSFYLTPGVNLIYPINDQFEIFAKLGISIILTDIELEESQQELVFEAQENVYSSSIKDWDISPTLGVGAKWNFGKNWSATLEYIMTDFKLQPVGSTEVAYSGIGYETQSILMGLRYNFD